MVNILNIMAAKLHFNMLILYIILYCRLLVLLEFKVLNRKHL